MIQINIKSGLLTEERAEALVVESGRLRTIRNDVSKGLERGGFLRVIQTARLESYGFPTSEMLDLGGIFTVQTQKPGIWILYAATFTAQLEDVNHVSPFEVVAGAAFRALREAHERNLFTVAIEPLGRWNLKDSARAIFYGVKAFEQAYPQTCINSVTLVVQGDTHLAEEALHSVPDCPMPDKEILPQAWEKFLK